MASKKKKNKEYVFAGPSPVQVGLKGCCPRCGEGRLYAKWLTPADQCRACNLDYSFIDAGDGPAFFVMVFISFVLLGMALYVETAFEPHFLVHIFLWGPLILIGSLFGLRFSKGLMISMQYRTDAREGRLE